MVVGFDSKQIDEKVVGKKETLRHLILCKQEVG